MSAVTELYRCEQFLQSTCSCDYACDHPASVRVSIHAYPVVGTTPKGVWIDRPGKRWVSLSGKKRYAYPTIAEAVSAFLKRKERQMAILKKQLRYAEQAYLMDPSQYWNCTQHLDSP